MKDGNAGRGCQPCKRGPRPTKVSRTLFLEVPTVESLDKAIDRLKDAYYPKLPKCRVVKFTIVAEELRDCPVCYRHRSKKRK
jgi:hypothetical protein